LFACSWLHDIVISQGRKAIEGVLHVKRLGKRDALSHKTR